MATATHSSGKAKKQRKAVAKRPSPNGYQGQTPVNPDIGQLYCIEGFGSCAKYPEGEPIICRAGLTKDQAKGFVKVLNRTSASTPRRCRMRPIVWKPANEPTPEPLYRIVEIDRRGKRTIVQSAMRAIEALGYLRQANLLRLGKGGVLVAELLPPSMLQMAGAIALNRESGAP